MILGDSRVAQRLDFEGKDGLPKGMLGLQRGWLLVPMGPVLGGSRSRLGLENSAENPTDYKVE